MKEVYNDYFDPESSMEACESTDIPHALATISTRYIACNPPNTCRFRAFHTDSFCATSLVEGRFDLNLSLKLRDAPDGSVSWIAARFRKEAAEVQRLLVSCYGPVTLYMNGSEIWRSSVREDVNIKMEATVDVPCLPGWNLIVLQCKKVASGFGCVLGPEEPRWRWIHFLSPFQERRGQGGFVYSEAMLSTPFDPMTLNPNQCESETGCRWFPERAWSGKAAEKSPFVRLYGVSPGSYACAWSAFEQVFPGIRRIVLRRSPAEWYLDGEKLPNDISAMELTSGVHDILAISKCPEEDSWDLEFSAEYVDGVPLPQRPPYPVHGVEGAWLYLGPFHKEPEPQSCRTLYGLFGDPEKIMWRPDEPCTVLRPYLEETCFGRWNYPLGVTLYGLTQASRVLNRPDIANYVRRHMSECLSLYNYSLWDARTWGYPEVNNQLVEFDMLDNCGSFGSAMLEFYRDEPDDRVRLVADCIADYMKNKQERLENGAFYRAQLGTWMENTMWVDDLYMSIPFLCRYAALSGESEYLEDAVLQVRRFREYLFLPESKVMSHVYDFKYNTATKMPWGRGNGWCLFSLSELLAILPEDHEARPEILDFFSTLCEGYLALQGSRGLWRQFLIHPDSYEETSCTAMFIYSFCRAIRFGWVEGAFADRLLSAAKRGWEGLCRISIDGCGNIYGVCRGSSYSFTADYYKNVLGWALNDTHGVGIVLLAGIELAKITC